MAFLELHFHSDALKTAVSVNVLLPEKAKSLIGMDGKQNEKMKTVYLLHGLSDDHTIWMRRTSIERYAIERGVAVIMPNVGRSWYTDTAYGGKYYSFVTEELPQVCRKFFNGISDRPEDTFVAGLSMGGYGAIKLALRRPDLFGGCASLSGAFDVFDVRRLKLWDEWKGIFGQELQKPADLLGTEHDIFALVRNYDNSQRPYPKMFLWCGTEDALIKINRQFRDQLNDLQIPHVFKESEGNHSWKWWDLHIQEALDFLLDESQQTE